MRKFSVFLLLLLLILCVSGCQENGPVTVRLYPGSKPLLLSLWEELQSFDGFELKQIVYGIAADYVRHNESPIPLTIVAFSNDNVVKDLDALWGLPYGYSGDILAMSSSGELKPVIHPKAWITPDLAEAIQLNYADAWLEGGKHHSYGEYRQRLFEAIPAGWCTNDIFLWGGTVDAKDGLVHANTSTEDGLMVISAGVVELPYEGIPEKAVIVDEKTFISLCTENMHWLPPNAMYPFLLIEFTVPDYDAFTAYAKEHRLDLQAFRLEIVE